MNRTTSILTAGLLAACASLLQPAPAAACGGFFCSQSAPVNQQAERIIFSDNGDGTVAAVIQILYSGPSERFAWVLPVSGAPDVGVSSNVAFQRLQQQTNPTYQLNRIIEGSCASDFRGGPSSAEDSAGAVDAGAAADAGAAPPVSVVDGGSVGPYDYVTIALNPELENPGDAAVEWLTAEGYDVSDMGRDTLGPYLASGMNLIAFRLTKGSSTGSIRPIVLTYEMGSPMIPIRPTAVAAERDMGVMVWVLGESRAVPMNYRHLVLNQALINWFNPGSNYDAVVTAAADESGGQGFVTEHAGPRDTVLTQPLFNEWEELRLADFEGVGDGQVLTQILNQFRGWDGIREAVTAAVPVPEGLELETFLGCPGCYYDWRDEEIPGFEREVFFESMEENVLAPMRATQELMERADWITRMYTTMSAEEMTMDPIFGFNRDLGPHSNQHVADQIIHCRPDRTQADASWTIETPNGDRIVGEGRTWPISFGEVPAARRIEQADAAGEPEVVEDRGPTIQESLAEINADFTPTLAPPLDAGVSGGGGCSAGGTGAGLGFALALLGLVALRRRR
ncbi:MAG TPA: DUF2330 domain-containing protein [Polyangiaceae bacterium LLY-WYZ-15_(1-7)]|nr:hypothetical protein [Sandaracinus sp.]HJL04675.1 DUF2330 domain-containing protein [Polyangiaceae bacterium LLY-WYZ-15_(1-7)]MBJ72309.1 hypothetical protein [Sandaracinus sp.]HJL09676.1 DUF2330 domain-containing protein [Polyangiaceae bacterium LLY-WYZ-15_(1-7)]HJL24156.1 DUF2330 domain-containing protein [Polyangiaceae bacterium LLY-WYZ-15_(1-7)]